MAAAVRPDVTVPEIDRVAWVRPGEARRRLNPAQADVRGPAPQGARPRLRRRSLPDAGASRARDEPRTVIV